MFRKRGNRQNERVISKERLDRITSLKISVCFTRISRKWEVGSCKYKDLIQGDCWVTNLNQNWIERGNQFLKSLNFE